ncbi:hypothetical protein OsI_01107 [Oryza sativa Indica Group]|uniref:Cathepsin propeptide inhibitor domain-containing protein n=1 Tax=Oryza sativa subsp. indica TaxID=39946 RepID=B8ABE9_ORYSI|nr:hypothetical protein OsI_01107 [Oryza sativa Indica Group]
MPLGPLVEVKLEGIFVKLDGRPPGLLPEAQFAAFVRRHWREYSGPEEYAWRLRVFAANLTRAAAHQVLDPTARHSVTPFSDLIREEFEARFTGLAANGDDEAADAGHGGGGRPPC